MSRFDECLPFILAREGGKVDDPIDKGGRTAYGITQATFNAYLFYQGLNAADVWDISPQEVAAIYKSGYWNMCQCDSMPKGVDLFLFDAAVQHGPKKAIQLLQRALGVADDGMLGPKTMGAVQSVSPGELLRRCMATREAYYDAIIKNNPAQQKFEKGWDNRMAALKDEIGVA